MSQQACGVCPALRAHIAEQARQIAALTQRVSLLEQHIAVLHARIAAWRAAITAATTLISKQQEKPTMPLRTLVAALYERLFDALEIDAGRRR